MTSPTDTLAAEYDAAARWCAEMQEHPSELLGSSYGRKLSPETKQAIADYPADFAARVHHFADLHWAEMQQENDEPELQSEEERLGRGGWDWRP